VNVVRWLGFGVFALGVALLALAVARGEAVLYLVLIFPVVQATGLLAFGAIAAMFVGMLLFFVAFAMSSPPVPVSPSGIAPPPPEALPAETAPPRRTRSGGVVFLGPFPIIFGSDAQVARWMIVAAAVLFVLLVAFWIVIILL